MIVLHGPRLVYVRTRKTASTSVEIALSRLAEPGDIVTALSPRDEELRRRHGGRGPQHHLHSGAPPDAGQRPGPGPGVAWWNHMPLALIAERMDLGGYTTFTVERHPAEKVVSLYYHRYRAEPRPRLEDFVASGEAYDALNWPLYAPAGRVEVDVLIDYNHLGQGSADLAERTGIPPLRLDGIRAKAHFRPPRTRPADLFTPAAQHLVRAVFAPEFDLHGYTWTAEEEAASC